MPPPAPPHPPQKNSNSEKDLDEVLQTTTVFLSVAKGVVAKDADLKAAFGTADHSAVAEQVLQRGELQVSDRERRADLDALYKDVAGVLVEKTVDPRTGRPFTLTMLERALRDAGYAADPRRAAKTQALESALPLLARQFPIERARMLLRLTVADEAGRRAMLMDALERRGARVVQVTEQRQQQSSLEAGVAALSVGDDGGSSAAAPSAPPTDLIMVSVTAQVDPAAFRELHALVVSGSAADAAKARDKHEARRRARAAKAEAAAAEAAAAAGGAGESGGEGGGGAAARSKKKKGKKGGKKKEEDEEEADGQDEPQQQGPTGEDDDDSDEEDEDEAVAAAAAASTAAAAQAGGARRGRVEVLSFAVTAADGDGAGGGGVGGAAAGPSAASALHDAPSSAMGYTTVAPEPALHMPPPPMATASAVPRPRELAGAATAAAGAAPAASAGVLLYARGPIARLPEAHASRRERFAELDALQPGWTVELRQRSEGAPVDAAFWSPEGEASGAYANARRKALAASKAASGGGA
jgi:ribosome maturation protein SDO1